MSASEASSYVEFREVQTSASQPRTFAHHAAPPVSSTLSGTPSPRVRETYASSSASSAQFFPENPIMQMNRPRQIVAIPSNSKESLNREPPSPRRHYDQALDRMPGRPAAKTAIGGALVKMYADGVAWLQSKEERATAERERREAAEKAKDISECTFSPRLSSYARRLIRPHALAPEHRYLLEQRERLQALARAQHLKSEKEMEGCTFRPLTLRVAKLQPQAFVRSMSACERLHAHAAEKQRLRARSAELGRFTDTRSPLVPEEAEELINRLTVPRKTFSQKAAKPKPSIAPATATIVAVARARCLAEEGGCLSPKDPRHSRDVFRRLNARGTEEKAPQVEDTFRPVISSRSTDMVNARALRHLAILFDALSDEKDDKPVSVLHLARAAMARLHSLDEAEELVVLLQKSDKQELSKADFINLFIRDPRHMRLSIARPRLTAAEAASAATGIALPPRGTYRQEVFSPYKFAPKINEYKSSGNVPNGRLARKALREAERAAAAEAEERECTFAPRINKKATSKGTIRLSSATDMARCTRGGSPVPKQPHDDDIMELLRVIDIATEEERYINLLQKKSSQRST